MQLCSSSVMWHVILLVLLMRRQYLQFGVLQKLKPLSLGADPCLVVLVRLVRVGLDGPGIGVESIVSISGFRVKKSTINLCLCRCEAEMVEVPEWLVEGSGSAAVDHCRCAGSANTSPGR